MSLLYKCSDAEMKRQRAMVREGRAFVTYRRQGKLYRIPREVWDNTNEPVILSKYEVRVSRSPLFYVNLGLTALLAIGSVGTIHAIRSPRENHAVEEESRQIIAPSQVTEPVVESVEPVQYEKPNETILEAKVQGVPALEITIKSKAQAKDSIQPEQHEINIDTIVGRWGIQLCSAKKIRSLEKYTSDPLINIYEIGTIHEGGLEKVIVYPGLPEKEIEKLVEKLNSQGAHKDDRPYKRRTYTPEQLKQIRVYYCQLRGIPIEEANALVDVESNGVMYAKSKKNANGLWQVMPKTALHEAFLLGDISEIDYNRLKGQSQENIRVNLFKEHKIDIRDAKVSAKYGSSFYGRLRKKYGDTALAYAAYNAGETNIARYAQGHAIGGIPPFPETRRYVAKNMRILNKDFIYVTNEGDTLTQLTHDFGISIHEFRKANGLDGYKIAAGQTLLVPIHKEKKLK